MRKAQMEILGLAIVVVLILVATTFVVRFLMLKQPAEHRKGFVSSETATNMLNTFLNTAAEGCSQLTMTELLQDCAQSKSIVCDNNEDSCSFVESTADTIFKQTLNKWNMKYQFLAYTNINKPLIKIGEACKADARSKIFYLPISTATVYVRLDICN